MEKADILVDRFTKELDPKKVTLECKAVKARISLDFLEHLDEEMGKSFNLEFVINAGTAESGLSWKGKKEFGCSERASTELYKEIKDYFINEEYEIQLQSKGNCEITLPDQIIYSS